jgi:hypothetical protein
LGNEAWFSWERGRGGLDDDVDVREGEKKRRRDVTGQDGNVAKAGREENDVGKEVFVWNGTRSGKDFGRSPATMMHDTVVDWRGLSCLLLCSSRDTHMEWCSGLVIT